MTSGLGADAAWDFEDAVLGSHGSVYLFANQVDSLWLHGTAVYWYVQTCDQTWACSYGSGYGTLPSSVFIRKSDRSVQLVFDPADYPADVLSVDGDPLGPVDITWTKDGSYSSSSSGTSEYRTRGYSFRTHGTYDADGARPVGQATPWVVPASATCAIHSNRQMEVTIFR